MKNVTALLGLLLISTSTFAANLDCSLTVTQTQAFGVIAFKGVQISTDFTGMSQSKKIEIQKNLYMEVNMNKICPQDGGHCFEGIEKSLSLQFGPMSSQTSGNTSDGSFSLTLSDSKLVVTGTCIPAIGGQ